MHAIIYSIFTAAMLAVGVLTQLFVPSLPDPEPIPEDGDKESALHLLNFYRHQVDVPDLTWGNKNLTDTAQIAANWVAAADMPDTPINFTRRAFTRGSLNSSYDLQVAYLDPNIPYQFGDYYMTALSFAAAKPFYKCEAIPLGDFYDYSDYTQMVWNSTRFVSMARAKNSKNGTFVVAAYSPAGNR
ncbi:hypothetical protein N8I77_012498 [Diaporthe amygdali]|uniref:SCP domain-containing protein n=1 Tax=Phomopsis amygdali TaxID=1214568 RepID=A0AAD9VX97_PHOAM|nr:hypothetical protein N8I77_012498 [Diaporthe amygdali]